MSDTQTPAAAKGRGPIVVSVVALGALFPALAIAGWLALKGQNDPLIGLLSVIATNATTIVSYWVGSSSESARKTDIMAQQPPAGGPK